MEPDPDPCAFTLAEWTTAHHLRQWAVLSPEDGRTILRTQYFSLALDAAIILDCHRRGVACSTAFPLRRIAP